MKQALTFTDKEKLVITAIKNYDNRADQKSDNYTNFAIGDANEAGVAKTFQALSEAWKRKASFQLTNVTEI